jgi:hypothetical protein
MVTALEISWPLKYYRVENPIEMPDLNEAHLKIVLECLSSRFPRLRRLYLSLEDSALHHRKSTYSRAIYKEREHIAAIVGHIDDFVKRTPYLTEHSFAVPELLFESIYDDAAHIRLEHNRRSRILRKSYRQVWRDINGKLSIIRIPFIDSYPKPPYQLAQASDQIPGYWILEGSRRPPPFDAPSPSGMIVGFRNRVTLIYNQVTR